MRRVDLIDRVGQNYGSRVAKIVDEILSKKEEVSCADVETAIKEAENRVRHQFSPSLSVQESEETKIGIFYV
ncbi:MAG: hypothetical protein Q8P86_02775 [bacterium]|nr:hypothetical protein [bacterium]